MVEKKQTDKGYMNFGTFDMNSTFVWLVGWVCLGWCDLFIYFIFLVLTSLKKGVSVCFQVNSAAVCF